jgi:hypothetical protein
MRLSALLQRVRPAQTQVDGPFRSTPRYRDSAQLSLLRARLYSSPTCPLVSPRSPHTDLATGLLAMLALLTVRIRRLFWLFVVAFNLVGAVDIILDYYHAIQAGLPAQAGPANWAHNVCHPGYPRACTTPGRRTARSRRLIMLG